MKTVIHIFIQFVFKRKVGFSKCDDVKSGVWSVMRQYFGNFLVKDFNPLFEKEGIGEILLYKSPLIPVVSKLGLKKGLTFFCHNVII